MTLTGEYHDTQKMITEADYIRYINDMDPGNPK